MTPMFRFTIRDVLWLTVLVGLSVAWWDAAEADEPASASSWNPKAAAAYLDERAIWWMNSQTAVRDQGTFCISCHTAVPYALARPALRGALDEPEASAAEQRLLANITKRVRSWSEVEPFYSDDKRAQVKKGEARPGDIKGRESRGTEAILNALVLANHEPPAGALGSDAATAFGNMWSLQEQTGDTAGAWPWLNFHNAPWEADDSQFYGATLAAVAVGIAPDDYRNASEIQEKLNLLREYLGKHRDRQSAANRVVLLWASTRWPGLLTAGEQKAIIEEVLGQQQDDGGWAIASLVGKWKRHDSTPLDTRSDGYATGLIVFALQQARVSHDQKQFERGFNWLKQNQDRDTGRWSAYSLNKNRDSASLAGLFMSDAATAYAVLALTLKN